MLGKYLGKKVNRLLRDPLRGGHNSWKMNRKNLDLMICTEDERHIGLVFVGSLPYDIDYYIQVSLHRWYT